MGNALKSIIMNGLHINNPDKLEYFDFAQIAFDENGKNLLSPFKAEKGKQYFLVIVVKKENEALKKYNALEGDIAQNALYDLKDGKMPNMKVPRALRSGPPQPRPDEFISVPRFKGGEIIYYWKKGEEDRQFKIITLVNTLKTKMQFDVPREKQIYSIECITV
ncbi:MAG TPA: hypothetical protein VLB02_02010 [Candidatus Paceibacterota bacterium]|nr:hypothetical protein [Candidatus Paceibacterota bacterium]